MENNILQVKDLKKYFGKTKAVDEISFNLNKGEIIFLTGPNGAGKTTTIKCILGLLRKTNGEIFIKGESIKNKEIRSKLAYIPESPDVYPMLTVWEHLKFMALAYRINNWEEYGEKILQSFNLLDKKNEVGKNLSKGMKQKLSICCSLVHKPDIFFIDEPMIGLDPQAIKELKNILKMLKDQGKTLLISTHILDSAEGLCDSIIIMKKGKIIEQGSIKELREKLNADDCVTVEDMFLEVTSGE
ncbi:ABC transporter ATP-binding protein [Clostridium rectalis]|uniref:ABC transporter ATP-binding protein n=1 Tax=Clostridium rectalis TaxID=2040295 RepID=UPI001FA97446|nr:ABC transporter ATP-binding protein [Clostridium rectalis]